MEYYNRKCPKCKKMSMEFKYSYTPFADETRGVFACKKCKTKKSAIILTPEEKRMIKVIKELDTYKWVE